MICVSDINKRFLT